MTSFFAALFALQVTSDPNQFNSYLLLGYGVMWAIFVIYIASLAVRQRNLRRDIELMEQILQEDDQVAG